MDLVINKNLSCEFILCCLASDNHCIAQPVESEFHAWRCLSKTTARTETHNYRTGIVFRYLVSFFVHFFEIVLLLQGGIRKLKKEQMSAPITLIVTIYSKHSVYVYDLNTVDKQIFIFVGVNELAELFYHLN